MTFTCPKCGATPTIVTRTDGAWWCVACQEWVYTDDEQRHAQAMHRWAERYDKLNGAPENDNDR